MTFFEKIDAKMMTGDDDDAHQRQARKKDNRP
jgi:hypothetical protein